MSSAMPRMTDPMRRHAMQIALQLPENVDEALLVLDFAREAILGFLSASDQASTVAGPILGPNPSSGVVSVLADRRDALTKANQK